MNFKVVLYCLKYFWTHTNHLYRSRISSEMGLQSVKAYNWPEIKKVHEITCKLQIESTQFLL